MHHPLAILTGILAFVCNSSSDAAGKPRDAANVADIQEAVFRHQFKKNFSAVQQKAKAYFLSIDGKDPKPDFLKRFEEHKPSVRPGSQFKEREGLWFRITEIKWIDDNTVEVRGGYYEHGTSASRNLYRVVRKSGKWRVEKDELLSIS